MIDENVKIYEIPEKRYGDIIFPTDDYYGNIDITNDVNYQRPHFKSWVYTNVADLEGWYDMDGIPMPIEFNEKLVNINYDEKGVYIIKTWHITPKLFNRIPKMLEVMSTRYMKLPSKVKERIMTHLDYTYTNSHNYIECKIRLVFFIPIDEFLNTHGVNVGNIKVTHNYEYLYGYDKYFKNGDHEKSVLLEYKYITNDKDAEPFEFDIHDKRIRLRPTIVKDLWMYKPHIKIDIYRTDEDNNLIKTESTYRFTAAGRKMFGFGTQEEINKHVETNIKKGEAYQKYKTEKIKADLEFKKYVLEHKTSFYKMLAAKAKSDQALKVLEKEDLLVLKEGLKLLKDVYPGEY